MSHYRIVEGRVIADLQEAVNTAIQNGYEPLGGVAVVCKGLYLQAMVNRKSATLRTDAPIAIRPEDLR